MSHLDRQKSQIDGTLASIDDLLWIAETAPNALLDEAGNLPLHYAATHGSIDAILGLLELGADASLENNVGRRASEVARDLGHIGAAIALRKAEGSTKKHPKIRQLISSTASKPSGEFSPTHKTNLIEDEADWAVPDGIEEEPNGDLAPPSFHSKREILFNILQSISASPEDGLICFYERMSSIFSNINIVLRELKEINSEILSIQEESGSVINGFGYIAYEIEKIIEKNNDRAVEPSRTIDKILSFCKDHWGREDFLRQNIIDHTSVMMERIDFSNFIISVLESFAVLVEGDLLTNVESGDQDLIDARIKLVPPLYEGLKELDRSDDCFQKEWSDILKSKSLWDREHWILPED